MELIRAFRHRLLRSKSALRHGVLPALTALFLYPGLAVTSQADEGEPPARKEQYFSLPMDLETDWGAANGDATILKFAPLYKIPLHKNWSLINMDLFSLADAPGGVPGRPGNPQPEKGDKTFGLSDLTHITVLTPENNDDFVYGLGFMATLPVATDNVLGSDKWSLGPAFRMLYRDVHWNLGVVGGNQWSYAGKGERGDINQLIMRVTYRRQLENNWFLISSPMITSNWKASSGNKWLVPLGGGIGKVLGSDPKGWAISLQTYSYAVKPDGAPDWMVRLAVTALIPADLFN